jgi:hypothetical protein
MYDMTSSDFLIGILKLVNTGRTGRPRDFGWARRRHGAKFAPDKDELIRFANSERPDLNLQTEK